MHDDGYLSFLRRMACCICGKEGETQACHIRIGFRALGKKPDDQHALPMCEYHHREQHSMNEERFYAGYDIEPFWIAHRLYWIEYGGTGGAPRKPKPVKPRKLPGQRAKMPKGRGFQKRVKT
jgi:hypothetical protein